MRPRATSREWVPDLGYPSGMLVRRFGIYYESTGAQPNDDPERWRKLDPFQSGTAARFPPGLCRGQRT